MEIKRRVADLQLELPENMHPLLRRVYQQRGLGKIDELELGLNALLNPSTMLGMEDAVSLLHSHLLEQSRVLIVSDFDADGATSCALAITALKSFGYQHVDYIVPNRFEYGYGLTPEIVELAALKKPDLLVTVDNGISSIEGVAAAKQKHMDVLVTDHHLPGRIVPAADAIVNPNQHGCSFASKNIAGVGVIFYVMLALRALLREEKWFEQQQIAEPNMSCLLDLVALGTVADVVALDRNNRILVSHGLKRIRAGRARPGIVALLQVADRSSANLVASDLGFAIGPRLNAAGRLDDMSLGIECMLSDNPDQAWEMARALDGLNKDRKQIEAGMRDQAFGDLHKLSIDATQSPAALCVYNSDWHQGVIGILASRIKDKYHCPVIAFANAELGDKSSNPENTAADALVEIKGSARSIPGFHIRDALDAVATKHPGLISKFGGHAMAAGLSLCHSKLEQFRQAFVKEAEDLLSADQLLAIVGSDGEVEASFLTLDVATQLRNAGPWGQGFPEPCFDGVFQIVQQRLVGQKHLKLLLSCQQESNYLDAIAFNVDLEQWPNQASKIELAYRMDVNEYKGQQNLQLIVDQIISFS